MRNTLDNSGGSSANSGMSARNWALVLFLGLIWGASFYFARIAVAEIPPLSLVFLRVSIAAAALHVYLAARGISFRPAIANAGAFAVLAVLNNIIPFTLIFLGQTVLGAGLAAVLNATTPFWTVLVANALTSDERITLNKMLGIVAGIAGTAVMIGPGMAAGIGGPIWPKLAILGATFSYAFAGIFAKRFRQVPPAVTAAGQLTASSGLMLPVVLVFGGAEPVFAASFPVWTAVFALAILSTALAYIVFFSLIASAGATNTSLVTLVVPVSALLLGTLFLAERLDAAEMAGMALIGVGLLIFDGRLVSRLRTSGSRA